jgi:anti-repressor protein
MDMAKELSMVENNEKGKKARRYFIAIEKRAKELNKLDLQKSKKARVGLTAMWKDHGIEKPQEYGALTNIEYKSLGSPDGVKKAMMNEEQLSILLIADTFESLKLMKDRTISGFSGCATSIMGTSIAVRTAVKSLGIENGD